MRILKTFNELYNSTYIRAAQKMGNNSSRANKLMKHASEKGIYKQNKPFENKYFNIFTVIGFDEEGEEEFPYNVIKYKVDEFSDRSDDAYYQFTLLDIDTGNLKIFIDIILYDVEPRIDLGYYRSDDGTYPKLRNNLFADRKSIKKFMKALKELYITHDPNLNVIALSKIHNAKLSTLTHEDVEDYNNFWKFLNSNGCDWEKFESAINVNKLWDDLMHKKTYPSWTSNNT